MMYLSTKTYDFSSSAWLSFILPLETVCFDSYQAIGKPIGTFRPVVLGFIRWRKCGRPQIIFPGFSEAFGLAPGFNVVFDSVGAMFKMDNVRVREDRLTVYNKLRVRPYACK